MNKWINEWTSERMYDWISERVNEWKFNNTLAWKLEWPVDGRQRYVYEHHENKKENIS